MAKKTKKFKDIAYIEIGGFKRLEKLLPLIVDCMFGDKKEKAIILLKFISNRLRKSDLYGVAGNYKYDKEDVSIMLDFLKTTKSPNFDNIARMLNEYTHGKHYKKRLKMYSELA
jgi:hypothetical protein